MVATMPIRITSAAKDRFALRARRLPEPAKKTTAV